MPFANRASLERESVKDLSLDLFIFLTAVRKMKQIEK